MKYNLTITRQMSFLFFCLLLHNSQAAKDVATKFSIVFNGTRGPVFNILVFESSETFRSFS